MMVDDNVIHIPPKRTQGGKRNTEWDIVFNKDTKRWDWSVVVQVQAQSFTGSADSEATAKAEVDGIVRKLVR